ncbi:hypothetical protein [Thioalkalivibrio sp.]|uniref:hypothetical protein n=1 Tax=Thioalkalivibrio sp. TaxID=2093813 RepID=UPI0012D51B44|nr:hypothetical protein [Thioalkalivibrio sp.]TVP80995.1 MAG: hypothetical protein EA346_06370 [Thioalkalivibrio sp.]
MTIDTGNWDQGELEDLFFWLQRVLQKYAENPGCHECLRLARDGLAQIRGGLDAVGRDDVVQLCEEMQRTVADLEADRIDWTPEGAELLVRASLQLSGPLGLTGAEPGRLARVLLPLVNELRGLRGAGRLMTPAIVMAAESPEPAAVMPPEDNGAAVWIRALHEARRSFQRGLLDLLHGRDVPAACAQLGDAASRVADALPEGDGKGLFRAAARLATGLAGEDHAPSPAVKQLLGRVDRQLGDGLQGAERALSAGDDPRYRVFPVATGLLDQLAETLDALEAQAADGLAYDRALLESAVLAPGVTAAPGSLVDALELRSRELSVALEDWREAMDDPARVARIGACFGKLRKEARAGGALRIGEFAGILASFIAVQGAAGAADAEAGQVIEDAGNVLPGLLEEVRTAGTPDTPVADIVLRAEAILEEGTPAEAAEEDGGAEPVAEDEAGLARMRRKGGADMARLAAAFAALEDGTTPPAGGAPEGDGASTPARVDARAQVGEIAAWHQRIVAALTQAAGEAQALERLVSRLRSALGPDAAGGPQESETDGFPDARSEDLQQALDELEQLRLTLGTTIGNASAALLQQHRATQALQDRLAIDPEAGASGDLIITKPPQAGKIA